jgi:stearoyl-CoA desaturase (delta-9 desaturase)
VGVTVGFDRFFTHRSLRPRPAVRFILAALGPAAIDGQVVSWMADHRKHLAFSDRPGDPHSPHVDHGVGWRGALRVFLHAHVGWHDERGSRARYAPDLLADPVIRFVDRTFVLCSVAWVSAFGLRAVIGGTLTAGMTGCCKESERVGSQIRGRKPYPSRAQMATRAFAVVGHWRGYVPDESREEQVESAGP